MQVIYKGMVSDIIWSLQTPVPQRQPALCNLVELICPFCPHFLLSEHIQTSLLMSRLPEFYWMEENNM